MIVNKREEFADSQAVTATAIGSTGVIDLGASPTLQDVANGKPLFVVFQVDTAATAAGAATVTLSVESDSTANLATSATVHATTEAIGKATLVAGYKRILALPPGRNYERYLGVRFTVATGPLTAGAFSAFLTSEPQNWVAYPAGS
ncbi:MAG TPA: hypothetical protein DCS97_10890 [Planctomycetes bacterium]|nr:hypothetical protein [Planctomycetota bacterium]